MSLITVIGRGHSGTRILAHTLYASGVRMGGLINQSGDLVQRKEHMYQASAMPGPHVKWLGDTNWDFSQLHDMPIPPEFEKHVREYLRPVLNKVKYPNCGWKLPETTLCYPWIARLFPQIKYVFLVRHPLDCILGPHKTDDISSFGVAGPDVEDGLHARAVSWMYQYALVESTPKPEHWIEVRFEDLVLDQEATLKRLESFLGIPLARIVMRPESVGRYRRAEVPPRTFDFLEQPTLALGYELN